MSIPGSTFILTALEAGGIIALQSLQNKVHRTLGGLNAQVTIEEQHHDELRITEHPVEQGAAIADHAYKMPATVVIRAAWSNSPSPLSTNLAAIPGNILNALGQTLQGFNPASGYIKDVYSQLLGLQESRQPFVIITGKRIYVDMLFQSLSVTTDQKSENSLLLTAVCKQLILVNTQVVSVPPRGVQKFPAQTAPVEQRGTVNLGAATIVPGV